MSYDDDHPEAFAMSEDDQQLIELERQYPDLAPWFDSETDDYVEVINQDIELPYDE